MDKPVMTKPIPLSRVKAAAKILGIPATILTEKLAAVGARIKP